MKKIMEYKGVVLFYIVLVGLIYIINIQNNNFNINNSRGNNINVVNN